MSSFSFERMLVSFEQVPFSKSTENGLPDSEPFITAMGEVAKLFDHLGTGFGFVRKDIDTKVAIVRNFTNLDRQKNQSLQDVVDRELKANTARTKGPPSIARTLLRLMWAVKFLYILMQKIGEAVQPDSKKTLRDCVSVAYDVALRPNHPFLVRQAASAAMLLLPDIDSFLKKLNVDRGRRTEYLKRIEANLGPLVQKMYGYYEQHNITDLP